MTVFTVVCETSSSRRSLELENYVLEVFESHNGPLIHRLQEREPKFRIVLDHSKDIDEYFLKVYATSSIGRSAYVNLTVKNERQLKLNQMPSNVSVSGEEFHRRCLKKTIKECSSGVYKVLLRIRLLPSLMIDDEMRWASFHIHEYHTYRLITNSAQDGRIIHFRHPREVACEACCEISQELGEQPRMRPRFDSEIVCQKIRPNSERHLLR